MSAGIGAELGIESVGERTEAGMTVSAGAGRRVLRFGRRKEKMLSKSRLNITPTPWVVAASRT